MRPAHTRTTPPAPPEAGVSLHGDVGGRISERQTTVGTDRVPGYGSVREVRRERSGPRSTRRPSRSRCVRCRSNGTPVRMSPPCWGTGMGPPCLSARPIHGG